MNILIFIIILIPLLLIPASVLYSAYQRRKPGNKFADDEHRNNFRFKIFLISLVMCGIAILILYLISRNTP